jgi:hypothetical protein
MVRPGFPGLPSTLYLMLLHVNDKDKCHKPKGARWHASTVRAIVEHERSYRGGTRVAREVQWPAIVHENKQQVT